MEKKINLKQLEKKTAAGIFETGIVEIGIGLIFVVSSLAMIFDDIRYYIDIFFIVPVVFIMLAVKYIAQPRMGVVKFARRRVRNSKLLTITITTFLVIMVTLTFIGKTNIAPESINPRWFINGIIFSICVAVAYFKSFDRMYIYAFLITGAFNMSEEIREHNWIISEGGYAYLFTAIVLIV
ncbi:MAG: hypothetical protein KAQ62_26490, partial [Cyclobacteriaceae bacterium]|nr:hypothetical protein [Cyclobacteriaceae bacterium]